MLMEDKLKKIFADLFSIRTGDIDDSMSVETVQSWDSLRHMDIVVSLEENFPIEPFTIDEIVAMRSFAKVREILTKKLGCVD
jgi:acyl carrier protein